MDTVARLVAEVTRERHPDLRIPLHSRWRHFEGSDGASRWAAVAGEAGLAGAERARSAVELAIVSVLLDAGAGSEWRYRDELTGETIGRSEGLALATFDLYCRGVLSSDPAQPLRADATALGRMDPTSFAQAFQLGDHNPLDGIGGRVRCLRALGRAVVTRPEFARRADPSGGAARRLGLLFDHIPDQRPRRPHTRWGPLPHRAHGAPRSHRTSPWRRSIPESAGRGRPIGSWPCTSCFSGSPGR